MTCEEIVSLLPLYRDDECSAAQRRAISAHLASCGGCAAEAVRYAAVRDAIDRSRARELPRHDSSSLVAAVMDRIDADPAARRDRRPAFLPRIAALLMRCDTRAVRWSYSVVCAGLTALALHQQLDTARCVADMESRMTRSRAFAEQASGVVRVPADAAEEAAGTALLSTITAMAGASRTDGHFEIPRSSIARFAAALRTDPQLVNVAGKDASALLRDLVQRVVSEQNHSIGG